MPINHSEACVMSIRLPASDSRRRGWAAQRAVLSPSGTCAGLLDALEDRLGLSWLQPSLLERGDKLHTRAAGPAPESRAKTALAFTNSGAGCVVVSAWSSHLQGTRTLTAELFDLATDRMAGLRVLCLLDPYFRLLPEICISWDDSLVACAVWEWAGYSLIIFAAADDAPSLGVLRIRLPSLVQFRWLPHRHTLLVACHYSAVFADVSVHPGNAGQQQLICPLQREYPTPGWQRILCLSHQAYKGDLVALCEAQLSDGCTCLSVVWLPVDKPLAGHKTGAVLFSVQHEGRPRDWTGPCLLNCAGSSLALDYDQTLTVFTSRRQQSLSWSRSGVVQAVWDPSFGQYLAVVEAGGLRMVILDRNGATLEWWTPRVHQQSIREACSSSGYPVLQALSVAWIGTQNLKLAVTCGAGFGKDGVWPAVLVTLLDFM